MLKINQNPNPIGINYSFNDAPKIECCECSQRITDGICAQCDVPYCNRCFKAIHSISKALRRHTLITAQQKRDVSVGRESVYCARHTHQDLLYYCTKCSMPICQQCRSNQHVGHPISTLILEVSFSRHFRHTNCSFKCHVIVFRLQNRKMIPRLRELCDTLRLAADSTHLAQKVSNFENIFY